MSFSLQWLLLLHSTGCRCAGFSSCGTWAVAHGLSCMWDLPGPGVKLASSALQGRLPTTGPPEKSRVRPFLGTISRRLTLQALSYRMSGHLQKGHRKLLLCGGNTLWHNSRKLYIIESYQILWVQETHVALSSKTRVFLFLFHKVLNLCFPISVDLIVIKISGRNFDLGNPVDSVNLGSFSLGYHLSIWL